VRDIVGPAYFHQGLSGFPSRNGLLALVVRQFRLAAHEHPSRFGTLPAFAGATADQFSLELCQATENGQHQPAVWCSRIGPGIPQGFESGALVGNGTQQIEQISGRPRQAIETGDHQYIILAETGDKARQLFPIGLRTADLYYVTGDVFRRDTEGFYYFVGRADDMFVSGGENIYPGEVEALLERHPAIQQAVVVAVPDDIKGQKPVAFVVRSPGTALSEQQVKDHALANAPAYQHPRRVWFLDELPLAGTNKIDRKALVSLATGAS
jgi:acyl-CoA synthetase (AMP-forming)/AMP-acid ligase II